VSDEVISIALPKVVVDALMSLAPPAYVQLGKREDGEPMYAEDVEDLKQFSKFIHAFAVEVAEHNPEILAEQKKLAIERLHNVSEALDFGTATHRMLEEVTTGHDCDTCSKKGQCEIEGLMRQAIGALELLETPAEGEG